MTEDLSKFVRMLQYRIKQKVNRPSDYACRECNIAVYFDAAAAYDSPVSFVVAVIVTYSNKRNLAVLAVLGILSSQHHLFAYIDVTLHVHKKNLQECRIADGHSNVGSG